MRNDNARRLRSALALAAAAALLVQPAAVGAQQPERGNILGRVVDSLTGEPIVAVELRLRELGRTELSHGDGAFHFDRLPAGAYTVSARRIGYAPAEAQVEVARGATSRVVLEMNPSALDIAGIVVTGTGRERGAGDVYQPTTVLDGAELRRRLASSVAATLAAEPGIAQRYNGPAAAQPVIRGLSGDRVLLLEDGTRTGDISSTGPDHAVTIDPLTAQRIEVVRGPASLLYGSNALGGVINVIREEVPRSLPEQISGTMSAQAESVNRGFTAGGSALGALGSFALRAELSGRFAGDTETPMGTLPATDMRGYSAGAGASWVSGGIFAGVAVRDYGMRYGVPGGFGGEAVPGAHEEGVEIDLRRTAARVEAGLLAGAGPFSSVELDGTYVRFEQDELEPGGAVGTSFGQLTSTGTLIARHTHEAGGIRIEGAVGAWGLWKDFAAAGRNTGTRPAEEISLAGYAYEELGIGDLSVQVGARYDRSRIEPLDRRSTAHLENVRTRSFGAFSGSGAALYRFGAGWTAGASVARSFRTPAIEELFSDGPHLATFAFEIGNPELEPEFGFGTDIFLRLALPRLHGEAAVYRNSIDSFIFYEPTGELDPRVGRYQVYRARQADARLEGFEGKVQWEAPYALVVDGRAGYVRGERVDGGDPLPAMPPLSGGLGVRYDRPAYFVGISWEGTATQGRVSESERAAAEAGGFDAETPGYHLFHATLGARWTGWDRLHTLTLNVANLTDELWRDHLSRLRAVAPQPGRNVQLLYRVSF